MPGRHRAIGILLCTYVALGHAQGTDTPAREDSGRERLFVVNDPEGHGFIDRRGKVVIPLRYRFAMDFAEDLASVWVEPRLCGYIDEDGREIIAPQFRYCRPFAHGVAAVETDAGWTFIGRSGTPITSYAFDEVGHFADDRGAVRIHDKWGYIDGRGNFVISPRYGLAWGFSDGTAVVYLPGDRQCQVIDAFGDVLVRPGGEDCRRSLNGVMAMRGSEGKYGYVGADGTPLTPFVYDWPGPFVDGLAAVGLKGATVFIDAGGRLAIPGQFDGGEGAACNREHAEGLIPMTIRGKCGYIDRTGAIVILPRFDLARGFHDGLAFVCADRRCGYIDRDGNAVWMSKAFR